jgi:hypothetical protein
MKKRSRPCFLGFLCLAVLFSGCRPAGQTANTAGNEPNIGCYQIDLLSVTESSEVASTWRYRVQEQSCADPLSGWMLELPACASVADASPTPWGITSADPAYQMSGIQWQTGTDFRDGEFSVTLTGDLKRGMTRAGANGEQISIGDLEGPVCRETAFPATAHPVMPLAKVKVQSANCRASPLGKAKKITLLYRNQEAEIVGRNEDPNNPWWYVKIPGQDGSCWLWGKTITTTGNLDGVPTIK